MPEQRIRVDFISEVWLAMKCPQECNPTLRNGVNLKTRADYPSLLLFCVFLNLAELRQNLNMYIMPLFNASLNIIN